MAQYLAELYLSRTEPDGAREAADRVRSAAEALSREGTAIRYLRTIFVPEDETCFLLYEAPSAADVLAANSRAGVVVQRVAEAVVPHERSEK